MGKQKSSRAKQSSGDRLAYSEFATERTAATARGVADLPPQKQSVKVMVSRKGRGGKTVTLISGFQHKPETLKALAKKLKAQCGTGGTAKDDTIEITQHSGISINVKGNASVTTLLSNTP